MNARMREVQRDMTARRRRKPGAGAPLMIPFDGLPSLEPDPNRPPSELSLEATGPSGEPAAWLDDYLWVDLLRAWVKPRWRSASSRLPMPCCIRWCCTR
jgi:hypothetical protein